uniref:AAA+ ATPase domain-containing protein n=1 Tax=Alexandrium monilatum TaxID=311494 RepID=A0A7S4SNC4_9DINO
MTLGSPLRARPPAAQGPAHRGLRRGRWGCFAGAISAGLCCLCSWRAPDAAVANIAASNASAVSVADQTSVAVANATVAKQAWWLPLQVELWHKRWVRRRLIKILNQAAETKKHLSTVQSLESRGPDGSRLVQSGEREDSPPAAPSGPPPRELLELLAIEDRIRRLRHLRRISNARRAAVRSARRLAVLRQHPVKRAVVRMAQLAGMITLGQATHRALADALSEIAPEMRAPVRVRSLSELQESARTPEAKSFWEASQALFDFLVQSLALRALRGRLVPKLPRPEYRVPDVDLDDVAGIGPAKAEALEIIECLMAPARFAGLGAKCPKGLLLTGPPGCGKTLLAKAIASTAAVPFIARSGADFNRRFAGAGSSLVKDLFRAARKEAPAVILIDELDYIGRRRGEERGGGLETDRSAALTQLLSEMDGFGSAEGVLVIGTTNRPDILDKALLRPGRFDRRVEVPLPDVAGRLKILLTHAGKLALESPSNFRLTGHRGGSPRAPVSAANWTLWARRTPGFSGADLAGLVNEAAMAAAREGAHGVGERHLQVAYSKALLGVPSGRRLSQKEMALTAAHEAGHAVVNEAVREALAAAGSPGFRTVVHMSIVPAGQTGGNTQFAEMEEGQKLPETRSVLLGELAVAMGGRAAEELHNGPGQVTMGAAGDFQHATRLATQMVTVGGLAESVGPRSLEAGTTPSQDLLKKVDEEVNSLLHQALAIVTPHKVIAPPLASSRVEHRQSPSAC